MPYEPLDPPIPSDYWMNRGPNKDYELQYMDLFPRAQKQQFQERDPNGKSMHEPGAKADAGKQMPDLVLGGFSRALLEVTKIGTFGARKYTPNGWMEVPDGIRRYRDAGMRHYLSRRSGELVDSDSGYLHLAHQAWNILAELELVLREQDGPNRTP